jgi:1-phosphatidylinositol-3-phosphate 5-kinase
MLKSIVAAASGEGSDQVAAAATSLLKQATETIASNLPEGASSLPIPLPQPPRSRAATFPLVDDDAGLLLSSEPHGGDAKAQTTEEDEDDLASQMLMRFPTYGTQSHALNKDSSSQWQEKTADWLLGGTASIPTPQQQKQQKQQQQQQLQKQQQQQRESGLLATVDEETGLCFPCEEGGNAFDRARRHNTRRQKLVNSHEWSVDEQLLWKTVRFPAMADFDPSVAARSVTQSAFNKNLRKGNTFTTRRGEVLTLKEHEKIFEQPLLEDPSRDFLAAYYYHLGVVPRAAPPDQLEAEGRKFLYLDSSSDVAGRNGGGESKDPESSAPLGKQHDQHWQGLIKQHSSPYHVNNDIRKDLALFGGLSALPESASEEKEGGEGLDYGAPGTPPRAKGLEQQQQQQQQQAPSQTPKDDRIAEVAWMPDRLCKTCYSCDTPFTVFRRRHHCRICGQVFCNTCSGYFVPAASTTSALPAASPHKLFNAIVAPGILADGSSSNNINSNNQSKITLRSCKQCYDQITAKQQEQEKKLKTAAEEEDKRRQNGNVAGGSEGVTATTPKRGTTPTAIAGTASPDVVQLQNSNGLHQNPADAIVAESAAFLGQWSKAIGAEVQGITSLATKAAGLVLEDTLTHDSSGHPSGLSTRHRLASHSSMVSSSSGTSGHRNAERNSFVREGHKHLGETAASHLEQMTAALLESDAPLLWKNVCGEVMGPAVTEAQKGETARLRAKWVNKLMGLATRCCATVDTNIKKGDMLDIRPYVKIKGELYGKE